MAGAFSRALERKDDCRGLFNHDPNHVLGRASSGTLRLEQDGKGLRYEIDLPDTQAARDLATSIERGDVDGSSFAFDVDGQTFRSSRDDSGNITVVREVTSVTLYDVSPVTYPAYSGSTVGMRGLTAGDVEDVKRAWGEWQKGQGPPLDAVISAVRARAVEVQLREAMGR